MERSKQGFAKMLKRNDGTIIPEADEKKFREFVNNHRWTFAKTYAAFCPHEYTVRKYCKTGEFEWFIKFIWQNGFFARYGKNSCKYFVDNEAGWYYFVSPVDVDDDGNVRDEMGWINRGSLNQWEIAREENLFGEEYICKRLPKERRKPVI